jgi:hypothetical protein
MILSRITNFYFEKRLLQLLSCLPARLGHPPRADAAKPLIDSSALPAKNCARHGSPGWERWFLTGSGSSVTRTLAAFSIIPACISTSIWGGTLLKVGDAWQYKLTKAPFLKATGLPYHSPGMPSLGERFPGLQESGREANRALRHTQGPPAASAKSPATNGRGPFPK